MYGGRRLSCWRQAVILAGRKTWELRSRLTPHRGYVGLIRKGAAMVVGIAEIVDIPPAPGPAGSRVARESMGYGPGEDDEAPPGGWINPWLLRDAQFLIEDPVWADQKPGAIAWVTLRSELALRSRGNASGNIR